MSVAALLLAAISPAAALAPLAPLAGHCWRGTLPDGGVDTHCYTWATNRSGLRDRHVVRREGKAVYWGVTSYRVQAGRILYAYRNADGPVMDGTVRPVAGGLRFESGSRPALTWRWRGLRAYVAPTGPDGRPVTFRQTN